MALENLFDLYHYRGEFLLGLRTTLYASLLALALSLVGGVVLALLRLSTIATARFVAAAWVEFIQNTPLLVQVFVFYVGLPALGIELSGFMSGSLGLAVYTSAFMSEALRSGVLSIPRGQMEAALSQGMSYTQSMRYVVLPQALAVSVPPLGNQAINLIKNSAILGIVAGGDLMYRGDLISAETFLVFETYFVVALLYLTLTVPLSHLVHRLEFALAARYGKYNSSGRIAVGGAGG